MGDEREWPPVPGDFEVGDPDHCVAICTLGKKIPVPGDYAIIGTCKTENIGIERVIMNIISNPTIRYLILAGPEVPGHLTGRSMKALHEFGVDENNRRIINAEGAIPYIENVPIEGVERFRKQISLVEMINVSDASRIAGKADELAEDNPGRYSEPAMWFDFKSQPRTGKRKEMRSDIIILPEFNLNLDPQSLMITPRMTKSLLAEHPTKVGVEVLETDSGTVLVGKEGS
ncbi:tetrahydromethanopterin S-methyltransferase subunit A [Candidatus Thorarchaeota archaeon]|nr:MAG: tetrahydromethanopterin S-methyltransferase subunit A [Candidatus Thorarchaeota archaeon]